MKSMPESFPESAKEIRTRSLLAIIFGGAIGLALGAVIGNEIVFIILGGLAGYLQELRRRQ